MLRRPYWYNSVPPARRPPRPESAGDGPSRLLQQASYNSAMRVHNVNRVLLWIGMQWGFLAVCSAQGIPGSPGPTGSIEEDVKALPKFQVEVIAFAYHDFGPAEERFEQMPRGTLLDLLNPTLLETDKRIEPDVSARLLGALLMLDEDSPALVPTKPGIPTSRLEALPGQPSAFLPVGQSILTVDRFQPLATAETDAGEIPATEEFAEEDFTTEEFTEESFTTGGFAEEPAKDPMPEGEKSWYRLLSAEELELTDAYDKLELLDAYTPLVHGGWVQEGLPEELAIPFDLPLLGTVNPLGTITLHLRRFLHVTVALRYQSVRAAGELLYPASVGLEEITLPARYDLNVQRRIRSGELHFFDHPAFGVLVLVRPQPEELEAPEDDLTPAA